MGMPVRKLSCPDAASVCRAYAGMPCRAARTGYPFLRGRGGPVDGHSIYGAAMPVVSRAMAYGLSFGSFMDHSSMTGCFVGMDFTAVRTYDRELYGMVAAMDDRPLGRMLAMRGMTLFGVAVAAGSFGELLLLLSSARHDARPDRTVFVLPDPDWADRCGRSGILVDDLGDGDLLCVAP